MTEATAITVIPIETPTLGDRSYLVHDGEVAFAVDPQRDIDRILSLLAAHSLRLTHVFESHIHNDYVTGGFALASQTGAAYLVNAEDPVSFERTPVRDGEVVEIGRRMRVATVATPGHTFTHLSYVLSDARTGERIALFSGGSLLYGATGRPDLLGPQHTGALCTRSMPRLASWPRCCPTPRKCSPRTDSGPSAPRRNQDLSTPAKADPAELRRRIEAGEWVVDLRNRTLFAAGHVPGSLNFGLDGSFATYLGWLIEWGTPLTLLGETDDIAQAQRELVRIGIDRPAAAAPGEPGDWVAGTGREVASFATATFADLADVRHHRAVTVLDVRRTDEFGASRIRGAVNIPLHELPGRLAEVPAGEVWVHCGADYRASIAASFLAAAGRRLVAIDDAFGNARKAGLPVTARHAA